MAWTLLLALPSAGPCRAGEWQLAGGVTDEIDGDRAPVATLGYVSSSRWPVEMVAGWLGPRRTAAEGGIDPTVFAGADLRWTGSWWFLGGGMALVSEQSEVLSSDVQFMTLAGARAGDWVLTLRHLSNAGIRGRNRGETFLTFGLAW